MIKFEKKYAVFLVLLIILVHLISNIVFLKTYPMPEGKDCYAHITAFNNMNDIISKGRQSIFYDDSGSITRNLIFIVRDYPPFYYLSAVFINMLLFFCGNGAVFTSSVYFTIMLFSVYVIGSYFNRFTGVVSAFICGMYPMIFIASRHFNLELAIGAVAGLFIAVLLGTEFLSNTKRVFLLGIICGAGMLVKQPFWVYISGPFCLYVLYSFRIGEKTDRRKKIVNLILFFCLSLAVSSVFYFDKRVYLSIISRMFFPGAVSDTAIFSVNHFLYYIISLKNTLGVFFVILLIFSCFNLRKKVDLKLLMLFSWVTVPFLFFTIIKLKYAEYTIGYLPAFALLSAIGIDLEKKRAVKRTILLVVLIFSLLDYSAVSYGGKLNFYSYYHINDPQNKGRYRLNDSAFLDLIADKKANIAFVYDKVNPEFVSFFTRKLFAEGKTNPIFVDYLFDYNWFLKVLDKIEVFIYISASDELWLSRESIEEFETDFNKQGFHKLSFSDTELEKMISAVRDYDLTGSFNLRTESGDVENIHVYVKRGF